MSATIEHGPGIPLLQVADVMHAGVLTCDRDTPLADVAATMVRERVHCVVVENGSGEAGRPWGIVSDLDLIAAATLRDIHEQTAGGSAATPVLLVSSGETLGRAAQLMTENALSHLVVVGTERVDPVGVLSTLDIARALTKEVSR